MMVEGIVSASYGLHQLCHRFQCIVSFHHNVHGRVLDQLVGVIGHLIPPKIMSASGWIAFNFVASSIEP